jgi:hypothetical protein
MRIAEVYIEAEAIFCLRIGNHMDNLSLDYYGTTVA